MDVDSSQFDDALRRYIEITPQRLDVVINKKAAFIILESRKRTPIADRAAIMSEFSITREQAVSKKTGKLLKRTYLATSKPQAQLVALVIWRLRMQGKPIPSNATLQRMASNLPGSRLRAVGSERQGWRSALSKFARAAGMSADTAGPSVRHAGAATVAQAGWNPLAEWEFDLATTPPGAPPSSELQIDPRVESALAAAFAHETASMEDYIREQLQPDADAVSAKG